MLYVSKSKEYETRIGRVRVERGIEREERREGRRGGIILLCQGREGLIVVYLSNPVFAARFYLLHIFP